MTLLLLSASQPVIVSLTPDRGPAQGKNLVRLIGTGFSAHGVLVTVEGEPALRADYISATEVHYLAPRKPPKGPTGLPDGSTLTGLYAVTVQNLDSDGNVIAGASFTLANAYTYERPNTDSKHKAIYSRITAEMVKLIRNDLVPHVSTTRNTEYDPELDLRSSFVDVTKFPGMALFGPVTRPSRLNPKRRPLVYSASAEGRAVRRRARHRKDLVFRFVVVEEFKQQELSLMAAFQAWFDDNGYLKVFRDPNDVEQGFELYPFRLEDELEPVGEPNGTNVRAFRGSFSIMRVSVEDIPGMAESSVDLETGDSTNITDTFEQQ